MEDAKRKRQRRYIAFIFFLLFMATWAFLLSQISPHEIVQSLGVTSGYTLAFIAGFLGGISTFTSVPYALIVITLGAGGLHPIILGFVSAIGLFLGDSASYAFGYYGHEVLPQKFKHIFARVYEWLTNRKHASVIPILIFLYGAFFPFSNDLVVISFGLARYPFWQVMIPLGLGSIVFNTILAYLGAQGLGFLFT